MTHVLSHQEYHKVATDMILIIINVATDKS